LPGGFDVAPAFGKKKPRRACAIAGVKEYRLGRWRAASKLGAPSVLVASLSGPLQLSAAGATQSVCVQHGWEVGGVEQPLPDLHEVAIEACGGSQAWRAGNPEPKGPRKGMGIFPGRVGKSRMRGPPKARGTG